MQTASLALGVACVVLFAIAMFPCAGWINWFNIPLAVVGLVLSIVGLTQGPQSESSKAIAGLCCCAAAIVFGAIRLMLGGGCF